MSVTPSGAWKLLKQTAIEWTEDKVPLHGAALAFYTALSIAPLLVLSLHVAAAVFGDEAARGEIERQVQSLVGQEGGQAVQAMLENANQPQSGIVATILSVATLLFGASGVFGQLQDSLNTIWDVQAKSSGGVWGFIRDRFLSMAMVMGVAFLLLVSLLMSAVLSALGNYSFQWPEHLQLISRLINFAVSLTVFTGLFAMMFKYLPDVEIAWRDVWLGAIITSLLFAIGKYVIGLYLGQSALASAYGVAGSLVVLLVWVYYSAQIMYFGAEFTQVYAKLRGRPIIPLENAERLADVHTVGGQATVR